MISQVLKPAVGAPRVSKAKFHQILDNLMVALEATFPKGTELVYDHESYPKTGELIHRGSPAVDRVYFPASSSGNLNEPRGQLNIDFCPWVDQMEVEYYRICFYLKNRSTWVRLARLDEAKAFGFDPGKPPYINLAFFREGQPFKPLFVKTQDKNGEGTICLVIGANLTEEGASLAIQRINEAELPPHLQTENP